MWQDTTECDRGADQCVQFFVTADSELQVAGSDTLDFQVLGGVSSKLEDFGGQVFKDGSDVDGSYDHTRQSRMVIASGYRVPGLTFGTNSHFVLGIVLEETLDTTAGKLEHTTVCQQFAAFIDSSVRSLMGIFSGESENFDPIVLDTRPEDLRRNVDSPGSLSGINSDVVNRTRHNRASPSTKDAS